MTMQHSPAYYRKKAKLIARQLKLGAPSVVRKYQKPAPKD